VSHIPLRIGLGSILPSLQAIATAYISTVTRGARR
jgi:hypothetical protein